MWAKTVPGLVYSGVILICLFWDVFIVSQRRKVSRKFAFGSQMTNNADANANADTENPPSSGRRRSSLWQQIQSSSFFRDESNATTASAQFGGVRQQRQRRQTSVESPMDRHAQQVTTQCLLYACNFVVANIWQIFQTICWSGDHCNPFDYYPLLLLNTIFYPLQGFFNFLIFVRPRYLQWRNQVMQDKDGVYLEKRDCGALAWPFGILP